MKKVNFSVLMSVYHKEKPDNLKLAIESIINQTLVPNEFIIVEDGPLGDELNNCLEFYSKKYKFIKLVKLKKNVGLGNALNEGLKYCSCEYVARMDSDDISLLDRFEKQIEFIKEHPDCELLGGNIIEFDSNTCEDISYRIVPTKTEEIKQYLKKRNPFNHVTVIFKKESVLNVGSYLDCPYFEVYYLWARMIKSNKKFYNIDECLVRVRAGLEMSGRRGNIKYIKCIINFENKLLGLKLISILDCIKNIIIRSIVSLMPNSLRYKLYQRRLRNEKN